MRRTPPNDHKQRDSSYIPSAQRRRNGIAPRGASSNSYRDDNPEIPRVRRASLRVEERYSRPPAQSPTARIPRKRLYIQPEDDYDEKPERDEPLLRQSSAHLPRVPRRLQPLEHGYDDYEVDEPSLRFPTTSTHLPRVPQRTHTLDEDDELELRDRRSMRQETEEIVVSPARQRKHAYKPPTVHSTQSTQVTRTTHPVQRIQPGPAIRHTRDYPDLAHRSLKQPRPVPHHSHVSHRQQRQYRSLLTILQDFSHNRTLMIVATITLVALIILPLIINGIVGSLHPTTVSRNLLGASSTQRSNGSSLISAPPVDPHEIVITPVQSDHPAPPVYATAAYLLDADTGATLYAHNPFMHLPVMSTTKIMTAVLAIENGNLDQKVKINDAIERDLGQLTADSALMHIKKDETYTLRDLLYGLLLVSGNDAAIAIADTIGGNIPHFADMMNGRASQLGMHDSHFVDPHGLPAKGHYSNAHDLAFLMRYAMTLPAFREITNTRQDHITQSGDHADHYLLNGNQFLWWYPGVDGGKTGWDTAANFVQVISCTRNNHHLIGVLIHTIDWWTDMRNLMNWGFNSFSWISPAEVDTQHPIPYDNDWNYFVKDKRNLAIPTVNNGRYYIYTGYSISGLVMSYFDKRGGLSKLGYPIGQVTTTGDSTISQKFEHSTIQCDTGSMQCKTV